MGCEAEGCEEDPRAQVLEQRVELRIDGQPLQAELADEAVQRDRGWRHRQCDMEALLLVPDTREPLPVWGCELAQPIDVAFIRDAQIVELARLEPCPAPCSSCPVVGEDLDVDAVLELPEGAWDLDLGTSVTGL